MSQKPLLTIAVAELRYWLRTNIILAVTLLFVLLLVFSTWHTIGKIEHESVLASQSQQEAEDIFHAQPDRHPHRMVHYGHYVFRPPAPLAIIEPGLEVVTGRAMFLEGHRHTTAAFADSDASPPLSLFQWLSPALLYQLFAPLLIILLCYSSMTREKESKAIEMLLSTGTKPLTILFGKGLAILACLLLLLLPMLMSVIFIVDNAVDLLAGFYLVFVYFIYLFIWAVLCTLVSYSVEKSTTALNSLVVSWVLLVLVLPAVVASTADLLVAEESEIISQFKVKEALTKVGDAHDPNDPAFSDELKKLLNQYQVDSVEQLPINFRGYVALTGEVQITDILNAYREQQMRYQQQQAEWMIKLGILSPMLATSFASRALAATDLANYHHFLRQAEQLRFNFVQLLNQLQMQQLTYADDMNRSSDPHAEKRTRVDSANWQKVLQKFDLQPLPLRERLNHAQNPVILLLVWLVILLASLLLIASRVRR